MRDNDDEHTANLLGELSNLGSAIKPLLRRLPGAAKAIDKLTGGLTGSGIKALASRLDLYRTGNLVKEAQKVVDATGLPMPIVFDKLVRQRRMDELAMETLKRVSESYDIQDNDTANAENAENNDDTADRWSRVFYQEASAVDEEDVREAFVRILTGEIQKPGSFSLRTLREALNKSFSVIISEMAPTW